MRLCIIECHWKGLLSAPNAQPIAAARLVHLLVPLRFESARSTNTVVGGFRVNRAERLIIFNRCSLALPIFYCSILPSNYRPNIGKLHSLGRSFVCRSIPHLRFEALFPAVSRPRPAIWYDSVSRHSIVIIISNKWYYTMPNAVTYKLNASEGERAKSVKHYILMRLWRAGVVWQYCKRCGSLSRRCYYIFFRHLLFYNSDLITVSKAVGCERTTKKSSQNLADLFQNK